MDANLLVFFYLFLRLAPFILTCFFTLTSIINSDFKGIIYLAGVVLASVFTMLFSNLPLVNTLTRPQNSPEICRLFSFGQLDNANALPIGQTMLTFTFAYLLYPIIHHSIAGSNTITIIFFSALILGDFIWNLRNSCYNIYQLLISAGIGAGGGVLWAHIVSNSAKHMDRLYFSAVSDREVCEKPSKSTFKCNVYKNGKLLSRKVVD